LNQFTKVEIPIIQRDYAQGRPSEAKIRSKFINHLADALKHRNPVELDFVYGMISENERTLQSLFIPIDGQQRLTTLFLLHWYAAWKENLLNDAKDTLLRFTYETRPSAHSFLNFICKEAIPQTITTFREYFINEARWFDNAWMLDPSVEAFVVMLDCIHDNETINSTSHLFKTLTTTEVISFYFLPLREFGLNEEIYTRMNARGKQLTPFEKFKSKLFAAIEYNDILKKEIEEKIEYNWIDYLWPYREKDVYTIDKYFMNLLRFIVLITFYERNLGEKRKKAEIDLDDEDQLVSVFDDADSVKFMIDAFDLIPRLRESAGNIELYPWEKNSVRTMGDILEDVIVNNAHDDATNVLLLYAAMQYMIKYKEDSGIKDYLTVVRNMVFNTKDKSQREWPRLLPALKTLTSDNIYDLLLKPDLRIEVIYSEQRKEEIRKAGLISTNLCFKPLLQKIENDTCFKGNINALLDGAYIKGEVDYDTLGKLYKAYKLIAQNDFYEVWGDLLATKVYTQSEWRVWFDDNYEKNPDVIQLAKDVMNHGYNIEKVLLYREQKFITKMQTEYGDLSEVNQPKQQLYLLYILSRRILKYNICDFFTNDCYRFGWLKKDKSGFSSPFKYLNDNYGMVYQCYNSSFQYNRGLLDNRTPKVLKANGAGKKPFEKLINFAEGKI
jgi:hypothetical protein